MSVMQSIASDLELAPEPALVTLLEKVRNHTATWATIVTFVRIDNATNKQIRSLFFAAIATKEDCNGAWKEILQVGLKKRVFWLEDYETIIAQYYSLPQITQWELWFAIWEAAQFSGNLYEGKRLITKLPSPAIGEQYHKPTVDDEWFQYINRYQ